MRIDKEQLSQEIEEIIYAGMCNSEELDETTEKIIKVIWPIIEYLKDQAK